MISHMTALKSTTTGILSVIGAVLISLVFNWTTAAMAQEGNQYVPSRGYVIPEASVTAAQAIGVVTDTTVADFLAGSGSCYVAPSAGGNFEGEVILTPTVGVTFTGAMLPMEWYSSTYGVGGAGSLSGGLLTLAGAYAGTSAVYPPSQTLEFSATFGSGAGEHIGLTASPDMNAGPWAIFSTKDGTGFYARTLREPLVSDTLISGSYLGSGHRYRIEWTDTNVIYSIDGSAVVTHTSPQIPDDMRPLASSVNSSNNLVVDWLRMSPFAASCALQSRVLDAGESAHWLTATQVTRQPADTLISNLETRSGRVITPDGSWSSWTPISGTTITSPNGRYIQYRVSLTTTDSMASPALESVALSFTPASQAITFNSLPNKMYGDPPFTVAATATSGLPVTFTASGGVCGVTGITVTLTGAGKCTVTAHQSGNAIYDPAQDVSRQFTITQATPVITWNNPADIVYGTPLSTTQLNATGSVPGTFVYSPSLGAVLNAGVGQTLHADFTPTDTANYTVTAKEVAITVTKATPTVVVTGGLFAYDGQPHAASGFAYGVDGVSDRLSPDLTFTYNSSETVPVKAGTYNVVGSFAGNSNYFPATNTATLTIAYTIYLPLIARNGS